MSFPLSHRGSPIELRVSIKTEFKAEPNGQLANALGSQEGAPVAMGTPPCRATGALLYWLDRAEAELPAEI
jgi:hypothetical protein